MIIKHGLTRTIARKATEIVSVILSLILFSVYPCIAQTGQAGLDISVLKAGVGARPLGMGGAFTAIADNADAAYWNPGGLGFVDNNEITTMQTKLSTDSDHYYVSYVRPAMGGTLGISWIQLGLGTITETSSEVDEHNEVIDLSTFSYFSNAYMISYGKKVNEKLSFGLTAQYLTSDMTNINGGQASGYSVTPGLLYKTGNGWNIGLKVEGVLNSLQWGTGTVEQSPAKLCLGFAYQKANPGLFAIDISQTMKSGYVPEASVGYEWSKDSLSLRLGYIESGLTAGAGFVSGNARVDYAYITQRNLTTSNVHRISLTGIW